MARTDDVLTYCK